jgi:DnaK suppressor protein
MSKHMTTTDLATFQDFLLRKRDELPHNSRTLESIAIERSADALEEAQYKSARELAVSGLTRASTMSRNVAVALLRIENGTFGICAHCGNDIAMRRLDAIPWTPFCIRCQEAADRGEETVLESIEPMFLNAA